MKLFTKEQLENLKPGLSGIMRVKNDERLLCASIDSCIDSLDELIIVYNDCTDNSVDIIEKKRLEYPDKIKVFAYPYHILSLDLNEEEFEYVCGLPDDSPNLLCNYYNFALSKVSYSYAIKIDADQIYFADRLRYYQELCHLNKSKKQWLFRGYLLFAIFKFYRKLSVVSRRVLPFMPESLTKKLYLEYKKWSEQKFLNGKAALSFSGINVFFDEEWYVTLGHRGSQCVILPPFNGEGDHLLFKVSNDTFYEKFTFDYYASLRNSGKAVIEQFHCPQRPLPISFLWFHLNSMRHPLDTQVSKEFLLNPLWFCRLDKLETLNYNKLQAQSNPSVFSLYQRILFKFLFAIDRDAASKQMTILKKLENDFAKEE